MGVAQMKEDGSYDMLLRDADAALYRAKHAGRNCVSK
jgi:PleD family two-component response regulator